MSSVPKVGGILYGNLFIVGRLKQPRTLAWYNVTTDELYIRPHVKVGSEEAHNLLHELGHRYWFKEMTRERKSAWASYHMMLGFSRPTVKMPGPGDVFPIPISGRKEAPIVERVEGGSIFFVGGGSIDRLKVMKILQRDASYPSPYAATSAEEHFAEAFSMYGLGDLGPDHVKAFEAIVIRGDKFDPRSVSASRVATRWLVGENPLAELEPIARRMFAIDTYLSPEAANWNHNMADFLQRVAKVWSRSPDKVSRVLAPFLAGRDEQLSRGRVAIAEIKALNPDLAGDVVRVLNALEGD